MPTDIFVNSLGLTYKGTIGKSMATLPDVCKTPSPGGPVPVPYPNFADQSTLRKGTKSVKAKRKMIAVKGSEYATSSGDEAGTAGGVKSSSFKKETSWITYSFDVKLDGKNACRHTDKKFHNKKNTVNLGGNKDPGKAKKPKLECGEVGTYASLQKKRAAPKFERDHIPSVAALVERAKKIKKRMKPAQMKCVKGKVKRRGMAVAIPKPSHRQFSPTCGGKNTSTQIRADGKNKEGMKKACDRDTRAMQKHLNSTKPECADAYKKSAKKIKEHDSESMIRKAIKECTK